MVDQDNGQQTTAVAGGQSGVTWTEGARPERRTTGAGRGPRGYRRRDQSIREELCEALTDNPDLDATDIEVTVEDGEVTFSGTVDDRDGRWMAEDLAEAISGVRAVHNRLRVAHE
jgi:osmotically-inducible protein OsmY